MRRVDLAVLAVEATSGAPVIVLREHDAPHRLLPIFVGQAEAAAIAVALSGQAPPRPLTHDVMAALVECLDGRLDAVELIEMREGTFVADLAIEGPTGAQRLDSRASDAIALAVRLGAPVYVSDAVLDEAGTLPAPAIDEAVEEFRSFLDGIEPSQFAEATSDGQLDEEA